MGTDALGASDQYTYDAEGNQTAHTDRNGITTGMKYNMYGSLMERSAGDLRESFGYIGDGLLSHAISGGMRYDYRYDLMGRLITKSASGKALLTYTYDADGNQTNQTDITGKKTEYTYDLLGRMLTVTDNGKLQATYGYDKAGRKVSTVLGDGIVNQSFGYDADGILSSLRSEYFGAGIAGMNSQVLLDETYQYDGNGNMLTKNTLLGTNSYSYDLLGRLTRVEGMDSRGKTLEEFTYDKAGNRLHKEFTSASMKLLEDYRYDAGNRLLSIDKITRQIDELEKLENIAYSYDAQGNMTSDGEFDYAYDAFNRLTSAVGKEGTAKAGQIQENRYDAEGLRHEMVENGKLVQFLFSNKEVVTETNAEGEILRYVRGLGIIASDAEGARTYYHTKDAAEDGNQSTDTCGVNYYVSDDMGSIRNIVKGESSQNGHFATDEGAGNDTENTVGVLNTYEYDAFGNYSRCDESVHNRFGYTGQQSDRITEQYYLRARFYNPVIGRFIQEDTYLGDGLNLFAYCQNNPLVYWDPTGHICEKKYRYLIENKNFFDLTDEELTGMLEFEKEHDTDNVVTNYMKLVNYRDENEMQPYSLESGDTVALSIVDKQDYFGVNSSISPSSKDLRKKYFEKIQWTPWKKEQPKHMGRAQSITHAEAHSLMQACENNSSLPSEVTMFVDRKTCNMCRGELPIITNSLGVSEVKVYSGGSMIPEILRAVN